MAVNRAITESDRWTILNALRGYRDQCEIDRGRLLAEHMPAMADSCTTTMETIDRLYDQIEGADIIYIYETGDQSEI